MNANEVIRIGRSRSRDASSVASRGHSLFLPLFGELDDQDGVLAGQPDEHDESDLRENVDFHSGQVQTGDRTKQAHGNNQDDRQGQRPALVLCGQDQEHEDDRQGENVCCRVARLKLQVSQLGPVRTHRPGQLLISDLFHQANGLSRAGSRRGGAGKGSGRIHVVPHDHHRSACGAYVKKRTQPDHLSLIVAHLKLPEVEALPAEALVCLDVDLPHATEFIEVINIIRAEVNLKGIENLAHRYAQGWHLVRSISR